MTDGIEFRTLHGATRRLSEPALAAFTTGFRGRVLGRSDAGYDEARKLWNGMIDRRPALIVRPTGTADVAHALRFAREHRLLSSVRGGGHNIAGLAVCEGGLMIDMSGLTGIWVDAEARLARAQAGCTLGAVDRETQLHGLAAVLGFVSETGIAGLTVGGGFGYLTRRYGWTCDNVRSVEVVTADGNAVRASEDENAELFWCLRGGGGNFGIVTSIEYRLYPVGPTILGGAIAWNGEDAPDVLRFYRELTQRAPRELTSVAALRIAPPAPWLPKEVHGKPIAALFFCYTGEVEAGQELLAPARKLGRPVADILMPRPYAQMQSLLDPTQPKGRRYYWKSDYLAGLEPAALETLIERAKNIPSPHSAILLFQVQGALGELPADHCPMGNRDAAYIFNVAGSWENPNDDPPNVEWVRGAWQAMNPHSTGGAYINFQTEDEGAERLEAAYGKATLERLAALKKKYDPEGLFVHTKRVDGAG
jgi:FAD/FMN-containing dehydrogenase